MGAKGSTIESKEVEIGEEVGRSSTIYRIWSNVYPCLLERRRKCTLFIKNFAETDSKEARSFFENGIKTLMKLRHPYITEYVDSTLDKNEATLITERVQLLDLIIDSLSPIEIHTGLCHILDALIFLHEKAGLSHNNICPSSIFVAVDGSWKLSGFECAQRLENSRHWVQSDFVRSIKLPEFAPAEDQLMLSTDIPPAARDAFAFGKLIAYTLPYIKEYLLEETVTSLENVVEVLTKDNPSSRGQLNSLFIEYPETFTNSLYKMMEFLSHFHAKTSEQRARFFETVNSVLTALPKDVVGKQLVPMLLSRCVLLDDAAQLQLLPFMLQPDESESGNGLFSMSSFKKWVVPQILRIFRVHEVSVRLALLSQFGRYISAINIKDLQSIVLKELLLGMTDTNDEIVSASLRAMADLVPILGGSVVTGLVHKKTFADGKPKDKLVENSDVYSSEKSRVESEIVKTTKFSIPSSLANIIEDDHVEYQTVTLELTRNHSHSMTEEPDEYEENAWDDKWEALEDYDYDNQSQYSSPTRNISSTVPSSSNVNITLHKDLEDQEILEKGASEPKVTEMSKPFISETSKIEEPDYFADMEPVVSSARKLVIVPETSLSESAKCNSEVSFSNRFAAVVAEDDDSINLDAWEAKPVVDLDAD